MKTLACSQDTNARSFTYTTLQPGSKIEVIRLVLNDKGNYWYEVKYDGRTNLYLYSKDVVWIGWNSSDVVAKNISVPTGTVEACKDVKLKGTVETTYNRLSKIESTIYMGSKIAVTGSKNLSNAKSVSISDDALKKVNISKLTACGNYKYVIKAECNYYFADGNKLTVKTDSVIVITSAFSVK